MQWLEVTVGLGTRDQSVLHRASCLLIVGAGVCNREKKGPPEPK